MRKHLKAKAAPVTSGYCRVKLTPIVWNSVPVFACTLTPVCPVTAMLRLPWVWEPRVFGSPKYWAVTVWTPTDNPVSWNCATPFTAGLLTEKPLLPSTKKVTLPPAGLEEVMLADRLTTPPELDV